MARNGLASAEQSARQVAALMKDRPARLAEDPPARPHGPRRVRLAQNQAETDCKLYQELSTSSTGCGRTPAAWQASWPATRKTGSRPISTTRMPRPTLDRVQTESKQAQRRVGAAGSSCSAGRARRPGPFGTARPEDIRLARQAEAEIEEAARTMRKARAYFSMGVTLNTAGAESQVSEAEQLYRSQNYEQSIRTAAAAIQQIRQATRRRRPAGVLAADAGRLEPASLPLRCLSPGGASAWETPRSPRPRRPPARSSWVVPPRPSRSRNPRQAITSPHPRSKPKASLPRREAHGPASPPRAGGESTRTASRRPAYTHCRVEKPPAIHYHVAMSFGIPICSRFR